MSNIEVMMIEDREFMSIEKANGGNGRGEEVGKLGKF